MSLTYGNLTSQRLLVAAVWTPVYCHYDALGSTAALTDSAAVVTDTYIYFAFGEVKTNTGTTSNRFTWVGELGYFKDTESGEYHLHQRQYQPATARFKSADPLGLAVDPNLYRYVGNDAVNRSDPSGMFDDEIEPYSTEKLASLLGLTESNQPAIGWVEQEAIRQIAEAQQQLWNEAFTQAFIDRIAELRRNGQLRRAPADNTAGQSDPGGFTFLGWLYDVYETSELWSKDAQRVFAHFEKEVEFERELWDRQAAKDGNPTARALNSVFGVGHSAFFGVWDRAFTLNIAISQGMQNLLDRDVIALRNSAGAATLGAALAPTLPIAELFQPPRSPVDVVGALQEVEAFAYDLDPYAAKSGDTIAQVVMIASAGVAIEAELAAASRPLTTGLRYGRGFSQNGSLFKNVPGRGAAGDQALLRQRVLANIEASKASRLSSNFDIHLARTAQVGAPYGGIDVWYKTTLPKGTLVYGGFPGQSAFYTDFATVEASALNSRTLFRSLQVSPHPVRGYRPQIQAYRLVEDLTVPTGRVLANPQFGPGSGTQFYIQQFSSKLKPVRVFNLGR